MKLAATPLGLILALCPLSAGLVAQAPGDISVPSTDHRVLLRYATFDPSLGVPEVPATLRSAADTNLWIVQFHGAPTDGDRDAVRDQGGRVIGALPYDSHIVRMSQATASAIAVMNQVRWVGPYQPAYRVEPFLLTEHLTGADVPVRKYNFVMADKRTEKAALEAKIVALGGKVVDRHLQSILFTVELTGPQLLQAARLDEVLWIDRWMAAENDMNNARAVQGSSTLETLAGYTGSGVRGHVYEGVEWNHPDFTTPFTVVRSANAADTHGHCTAGCIFGNGNSAPQARGHAPGAVGFFTQYSSVTAGWSRNMVISDVVNVHNCMFTTASWGNGLTTTYNSTSADADDIVFDHRIPWTNSMSNQGNNNVRPEAWAKNVISIGGLFHRDDAAAGNDTWSYAGQPFGSASIGPSSDGRLKPDLCNFYDDVWTSDRSGAAGYAAGNSFTGFNGTSSATPITAGLNALAIQMYTDHIFNNTPRVSGGTRFQNRPYAQTLKALQIACASLYPVAQATRAQAGWGYGNVATMYNRRNRMMIIPENVPITQGATHTYNINVLNGETSLKVCMTYLDPQGNPAAAIDRINDLTLRVIAPNGTSYWGNNGLTANNTSTSGGAANTIDTVENVFVNNPAAGDWTIQITAPTIAQDAHVATAATDATYALVVNGGIQLFGSGCARYIPDTGTTGTINTIPFGTSSTTSLPTVFATNNNGNVGGAVYFDVTSTTNLYLADLDVNTIVAAGTPITIDVYRRIGTHVGNEGSIAGWTPWSAGHGVSAGLDLPSTLHLNDMIPLAASTTYGIAIVARNFEHRYTNGTGTNQSYSDANLTITLGTATNVPFTAPVFSPRVANVNFKYRTDTSAWTNQRYQTILRREELGSANTITGLAFSPSVNGTHWNRNLQIRMSHVPAGHTLSTTFATNLPTPVTVLNSPNYTFHTLASSWTEVGLQSSFAYDGTSDVVVDIIALANHASGTGGFNRSGSTPRAFASDWAFGGTPTVASGTDNSGQRMRVSFACANANEFGTACGSLLADHVGSGAHGTTFNFHVHNAPANAAAIVALGFNNGSPGYPQNLNSFGFTNCTSWNTGTATLFYVCDGSGFANHALGLPNTTAYDGLKIYGQWFVLDPTQAGGLTNSAYTRLVIGYAP